METIKILNNSIHQIFMGYLQGRISQWERQLFKLSSVLKGLCRCQGNESCISSFVLLIGLSQMYQVK